MRFPPSTLVCQPLWSLFRSCLFDYIFELSQVHSPCYIQQTLPQSRAPGPPALTIFWPHFTTFSELLSCVLDVLVGIEQYIVSCSLDFGTDVDFYNDLQLLQNGAFLARGESYAHLCV